MEPKQRPDFSQGLVHFTRPRIGKRRHFEPEVKPEMNPPDKTEVKPLEVLAEILKEGVIKGSTTKSGYIKGRKPAVCFSELPLANVRYFFSVKPPRYAPYGIATSKEGAFALGARPVIYLPDNEGAWIQEDERWRHVRFEFGMVDHTDEREWRLPGDLDLCELRGFYVLHWNPSETKALEPLAKKYKNFRGFLPLAHLSVLL